MIDTKMMKIRMLEKEKNIQCLAQKIGKTPYTTGKKLSNKTSMTLEEAYIVGKELEITKEEFSEFFLQQKLQNATKSCKMQQKATKYNRNLQKEECYDGFNKS